MSKVWRAHPLWVYTHSNGDQFVLPGEREFALMEESLNSMQADLDSVRSKKDKDRAAGIELAIERSERQLAQIRKVSDDLRPKSVMRDYHIARPTFAEFLAAEEDAKDWIVGEPRVDEGKLCVRVLAGNVKEGESILDQNAVGSLDPMIAQRLWDEMKTIVRPNPDRLPFLNLPSKKPSKES